VFDRHSNHAALEALPPSESAERPRSSGTRPQRRLPVLRVASLLAQQRSLTAVDRFAEHDAHAVGTSERRYRDLIPLERPKAGEQYAFEVNLDACTGCKACVVACHALNGLDEGEVFRSTGLLRANTSAVGATQTVTSSCHHCLDPACLTGCPVSAYEKDALTGIVRHLDDQCIGCQYCTLMCPYDAPQYNAAKGIVRKCDMCSDRLAHDQPPACVEACPSGAISIRNVARDALDARVATGRFLPGAAHPAQTRPTTEYTARAGLEQFSAIDEARMDAQPAPASLVVMLTLTQLAAGAAVAAPLLEHELDLSRAHALASACAVALSAGVGVIASLFHLGRPWLAHRAVLGLRTSWLSREAVVLGVFALLAAVSAALLAMTAAGATGVWAVSRAFTALLGVCGVWCSVMVYAATQRAHWTARHTALRFFTGTVVLGASTLLTVYRSGAAVTQTAELARADSILTALVILASLGKLLHERLWLARPAAEDWRSPAQMVRLMRGALQMESRARSAALLLGGVALPVLSLACAPGGLACLLGSLSSSAFLLVAELLDRYLFFAAAPPATMARSLR
jgi:formate dehydrogenase iron-sulfur subunit